MARIFIRGPELHLQPGEQFCAVCSMGYLGWARRQVEDEIKAATASDDPGAVEIRIPPPGEMTPLNTAVTLGIFAPWSAPPLGSGGNGMSPFPMPLCWTHLMGVDFTDSVLQPGSSEMAGMLRGGAKLLGR
jgi:hypothetical protein